MHIKSTWSYLNKGLLIILSFLVISTVLSIIFLINTLIGMRAFTTKGGHAVTTAFVLQDILSNVQDMQSGVRGYVLTSDHSYLDPYTKADQHLIADVNTIHTNHTLLLSSQQVERIDDLIQKKRSQLEGTLHTYDTLGFDAAKDYLQASHSEQLMQDLRQETSAISSVGLQNIGPMQKRSDANLRRALYVVSTMALLVFGTCAAVIWYFKRAILRERALDSTKNEFLSLASHQLRTPATNVKQYLGLLMDGYMGDLTQQQRDALAVAYRNNESEISIMNNLLDVAKLDLERIQLHKKVTNVMTIAKRVIREYTPQAHEWKQTLKLEGPKQVMALVDETYIKGVIENLVDNSLKYSNKGTTIVVIVSREQDSACIAVQDQGLGIRKRDYGKLFNKFSRLDNEFSANSQGSGLGLYWVKQIINLHSGTIEVSSKEGKGSTFTVKLPIR